MEIGKIEMTEYHFQIRKNPKRILTALKSPLPGHAEDNEPNTNENRKDDSEYEKLVNY